MASIRHHIPADAAGIAPVPRQPNTLFSDAAALSAYPDETAAPDTAADRIVAAILQLAPRLREAREPAPDDEPRMSSRSLRGLRLGIAGPSVTHCALADRLRTAFGMAISCACADGKTLQRASEHGFHVTEDDEALLGIADVVVAVDGAGFRIDNPALNAMRPHAVLVADVDAIDIDQVSLAYALWFETIAGAGIVTSTGAKRLLPELEKAHNVVVV